MSSDGDVIQKWAAESRVIRMQYRGAKDPEPRVRRVQLMPDVDGKLKDPSAEVWGVDLEKPEGERPIQKWLLGNMAEVELGRS